MPNPTKASSSQRRNYRVQEETETAVNCQLSTVNCLFFLHDGRPMPPSRETDALFLKHGLQRNLLKPRGYSQPFPADIPAARLLKLRALFGVNARCEILDYLARNGTGHPRGIARELYFSQKSVHDTLTDLACSGVITSSKGPRERIFRLNPGSLPFLDRDADGLGWINWPVLLSAAERVWHLAEDLCATELEPQVVESEIALAMGPVMERLVRSRWMSAIEVGVAGASIALLREFRASFERVSSQGLTN